MTNNATPTQGDAATIIAAVQSLYGHQVQTVTDPRKADDKNTPHEIPVAVMPQGLTLQDLKPFFDKYASSPERRKGTFYATDAQSFVDHCTRFKRAETAIFANRDWKRPDDRRPEWLLPSLTAIYDYHQPASYSGADKAGWLDHRATYDFSLSEPFKAWAGKDGEAMAQGEFAGFLEDNCLDIAPAPIVADMAEDTDFDKMVKTMTTLLKGKWGEALDLMDLARVISVHEKSTAEQTTNLKNGTGGISFTNEHRTGSGEIFCPPDLFMISLPIFVSGERFSLPVRLKYRIKGGVVAFFFEIFRLDLAFDLAFSEACASIAEKTGLPLMYGTPEGK